MSGPRSPGKFTSSKMRSGILFFASGKAKLPVTVLNVLYPSCFMRFSSIITDVGSSSTIRTVIVLSRFIVVPVRRNQCHFAIPFEITDLYLSQYHMYYPIAVYNWQVTSLDS